MQAQCQSMGRIVKIIDKGRNNLIQNHVMELAN